ncbi:hypothetical protein BGX26_008190, partial [Mortierella sp. AD094]
PELLMSSGALTTVGFYQKIESYSQKSEYLVLTPSVYQTPTPPPLRVYQPEHNEVSKAFYREDHRLRKPHTKHDHSEDAKQVCGAALENSCLSRLNKLIQGAVAPILSQKEVEDCESQLLDAKEKLEAHLTKLKRLPGGTLDNALAEAQRLLSPKLTKDAYQSNVGSAKSNIERWRRIARGRLGERWQPAVENYAKASEKSENSKKSEILTCTVPLSRILRQDMGNYKEKIVETLDLKQRVITNIMMDLSGVIHKTLLAIASGELYSHHKDLRPFPVQSFDVSILLLDDFEPRSDIDPEIEVSPLPALLQEHLVRVGENRDDIAELLTEHHLSFLKTRFLGVRNTDTKGKGKKEEEWSEGEEDDDPQLIPGMSITVASKVLSAALLLLLQPQKSYRLGIQT